MGYSLGYSGAYGDPLVPKPDSSIPNLRWGQDRNFIKQQKTYNQPLSVSYGGSSQRKRTVSAYDQHYREEDEKQNATRHVAGRGPVIRSQSNK